MAPMISKKKIFLAGLQREAGGDVFFINIFDLKKYEESLWAGLQGEAGGDVRFNSEGDAVSNDHDIYHALRYI